MSAQSGTDWEAFWGDGLAPFSCRGLSASEIEAVARSNEMKVLPRALEGFLSVAGGGVGQLWVGSRTFYPDFLSLRGEALELLSECDTGVRLQDGDVVFLSHQGYQFLLTRGVGEDPPVFNFVEGGSGLEQRSDSFSQFVVDALDRAMHQ